MASCQTTVVLIDVSLGWLLFTLIGEVIWWIMRWRGKDVETVRQNYKFKPIDFWPGTGYLDIVGLYRDLIMTWPDHDKKYPWHDLLGKFQSYQSKARNIVRINNFCNFQLCIWKSLSSILGGDRGAICLTNVLPPAVYFISVITGLAPPLPIRTFNSVLFFLTQTNGIISQLQ